MATSRGNNTRRYNNNFHHQTYANQRPNQTGIMQPFPNMHPAQPRAPLIGQNPPIGIHQFSGPRVPAPMMFPQAPQLIPRPHFHQPSTPQFSAQGAYYPPHHAMMSQTPAPQILSNSPMGGAPKGSSLYTPPATVYQQPSQHQVKKRSNAIAIIDPDTKEEVKAVEEKNPLKAGGSSTNISSNTLVSSAPTPTKDVKVEFKSKVQGTLDPSAAPKPNAIISTPGNTGQERTIKPPSSGEGHDKQSIVVDQQKTVPESAKEVLTVNSNTVTSSTVTKNSNQEKLESGGPSTVITSDTKPAGDDPVDVAKPSQEAETVSGIFSKVEESDNEQQNRKDKETEDKIEPKLQPPQEVPVKAETPIIAATITTEVPPPESSSLVTKDKKGKNEKEHQVPLPTLKGHKSSHKESKSEPEKNVSSNEVKQEEQPKVPEKKSLLGEPTGHMTIATTPPTIDYELEEGELPSEDEVIMNGNIEEADFGIPEGLGDHDQRKYDRNFLLEYRRLATDPPEKLRSMTDVFCPHGVDMSGPYHRKPSKPPKRVIDHKPQALEKVELHKAEKRWVRALDQEIPEEARKTQELFRKFQGILNKLTPQKFSDLAQKAQQLDIDTEEKLQGCIDRIFEKALEEPNFSIAYANLCRVLSNIKVNVIRSSDEGNEVVKETSFRRELLTKCQKEFEKDKKDDENRDIQLKAIAAATSEEEKKKKQEEFDEWETVARRRSLGNIRFIGELFKLKMLSEGIMHDCILRLLRSTSDQESLECFCRLITTTGKELDHPQAKVRLDRYFERIYEIIEKKKISSRIKFMLQDVQDLRKSDWVPRRQEGLKTIDQIHHEAKIEELAEQEMIKQMAVVGNTKPYPRDDKKRGSKTQDEFTSTSSRPRHNEKRGSAADVNKILAIRKKDGGQGSTLGIGGGGLRPSSSGWGVNRKKDGQTPPPAEKERPSASKSAPQKSSGTSSKRQPTGQTGSARGNSSLPGSRRSSSQPNERQSVFNALNKVVNQSSTNAPPPPTTTSVVKKPALSEDTIRRKTCTIVDEFVENKDYNEAIVCTNELDSPNLLNVFVCESILHTLEKSTNSREYAGRLLECLYRKNVISKEMLHSGLKEVVGMIEDLEVDIPKVWNFLAEILSPLFICECLVLTEYYELISEAGIGYKAPRALARLLQQCVIKSSKGVVSDLWTKSKLKWTSIGLDDGEEVEFLEDEKLQFLSSSSISSTPVTVATPTSSTFDNPPYFKDLVVMFGRADTSNDEIFEWIQSQKIKADTLFIRSLSRASIDSSTSGEGDNCILSDENFRKRLPVVKRYVDQNEEFQLQVLNAMQYSMDLLKHPPNLLSTVFWSLYDVEVVSEAVCYEWKRRGGETIGRGMALQTSKSFFDWLDSADQESDLDNNS